MLRFIFLFSSVFAVIGCTNTQKSSAVCNDESLRPEQLVTELAIQKNFPGIAVAIGVEGKQVWSYGYGLSEIESNTSINPNNTMFRIGSTSKALTALALARLSESNQIDIDRPIGETLSDLPSTYDDITLRQLGGHLGGIRHYLNVAELGNEIDYQSSEDALAIFIDDPLIALPGSQFSYSTYGYTVISAVLEKVSDTDFLTLMSNVVFDPLDMKNTVADKINILPPDRTQFYYLNEEMEYIIGDDINSSNKWAGGGFLASVVDLVSFGNAHFNEKIISEEGRNLLWSSQQTLNGDDTDYGLGWFVDDDWVQHPGGALGGSVLLRIYPEQKVVIAIAANLSLRGEDRFDDLPQVLAQCFNPSN